MGRRNRNRARTVPVDHVARVRVADAVWTEFRRSLGTRSVALALGELVEREVARQRAARIRRGSASDREVLEALDAARTAQGELAEIVARLEARACAGRRSRSEDGEW